MHRLRKMGTWLDILILGAEGDSAAARHMLQGQARVELLLSPESGTTSYQGLLPKAIASFVNRLPEEDRSLARLHQDELVDYVMDDVITGMEKPLLLIELCLSRPDLSLEELVELYPWEEGLKRSAEWKRKWLADTLQSLLDAGVPLPASVMTKLGDEGEANYEFNEIKYALKAQRLEWSWEDFKKKQNLSAKLVQLVDEETEEDGVWAESVSYGGVTIADIVLRSLPEYAHETSLTLAFAGEELTPQLTALVEEMHKATPSDGCHPISWHNVYWYFNSEYGRLRLRLETREPYHEKDEKLAAHLAEHYPEVVGTSRSTVRRRRMAIQAACEERIHARLKEKLGRSG